MIYKLRIISDEVETFLRIIEIQDTDNFESLHHCINKACGFDKQHITSFYVSDKDWDKKYEITLLDMNDEKNPTLTMKTTILKDHISKVDDTLIYMFDFFADRALFVTLTEIKEEDKKVTYPICSYKTGNPPHLADSFEQEIAELMNNFGENEDEYDFEDDDIKGEFDEFSEGDMNEFGESKEEY